MGSKLTMPHCNIGLKMNADFFVLFLAFYSEVQLTIAFVRVQTNLSGEVTRR